MSSDLKVTNIKHESSGSNNLVLASDGNVSITNTLSAGTLGSSVVFPAGKILQVKEVTLENFNTTNTTTELGVFNNASSSFTIASTSNHVYVHVMATAKAFRSTSADCYATISEGTTSSIGDALANGIQASTQGDMQFHFSMFGVDKSPASTTPQYVFTIQRNTGGTSYVHLDGNSTYRHKMVLMEIQQ